MKLSKKFKITITFIVLLLIGIYFEIERNMGKPTFYKEITRNLVSQDFKKFVKYKIFSSKYEYIKLESTILELKERIDKQKKMIGERNVKISELISEVGLINFKKTHDELINIEDIGQIRYVKFGTNDLLVGKNPRKKILSTSYFDFSEKNIFLISGDGILSYSNFENFKNKNNLSLKIISTNLKNIIKDNKFFENSYIGVKDLKIIDENIYISFSKKISEDCYNTSILKGNKNLEKINFEKFFSPKSCVSGKNDFGVNGKWAQGGRIINFNSEEILFTVGTWGQENLSQDKQSVFGKILAINKNDSKHRIISYGHRNPQGLAKDGNFLIESEHGPTGGDELNIINLASKNDLNYGWPISSYGEHTGYDKSNLNLKSELYKKAPLHKSHKDYGFIEPIRQWTPSLGVSEVVNVKNFFNNDNNLILLSALGDYIEEGDRSVHFLSFDKNYENILNEKILPTKERIRDIIYIEEHNCVAMYFESSAEIALIFFKR